MTELADRARVKLERERAIDQKVAAGASSEEAANAVDAGSAATATDTDTGLPAAPAGTAVEPPAPGPGPKARTNAPRERVALRVHPDTKQRGMYWANKAGLSLNEYFVEAIEEKIARENGDYPLPTLEQARLGQLVDEIGSLSRVVTNLQAVTMTTFDSMLVLAKGDNYLITDEDGELGDNLGGE